MTTPRGCGDAVLYLDYDGALHHEDVWWTPRRGPFIKAGGDFRLFQHAHLLSQALEPHPRIAIVLSTSWVRHYRFTKAARFLPLELRRRVIGATFHTDMHERSFATKPRGLQIWEDVQRRQPKAWLALDDDDELWPEALRANLIKTHPELGISEPNVLAELRVKLALLHRLTSSAFDCEMPRRS